MRYQTVLGNCGETTVSGLISQCAQTSAVFEKIGVSPAQHGDDTIHEAAERGDVEPGMLCQQLFDVYMEHKPLEEMETDALMAIIAEQYEAVHQGQLPKLHRLARKIEAVHRDSPDVPRGVTLAVKHLEQLVSDHHHGDDVQAVSLEKQDLDNIKIQLKELRELTDSYQPPEAACRSWRRLYDELKGLDFSLSEQIYLEQNILFPRLQF